MKYCSTRGGIKGWTFEQALFSGFLKDGGIILPEKIPKINMQTLKSWSKFSYLELMKKIVSLFVEEEIPSSVLNELLDDAFSSFTLKDIARVQNLSEDLNILELFHGPTLAFKDLGLSVVGQLLQYFLEKRKKHITVVVATSGDTGSAAIEAVRGLKSVDIIVLLPRGRVSRIQELQMITVIEDNVHVYRMDGTSDDLDVVMKDLFSDTEFIAEHNISCMNSVNWARVMAQITHNFYAYFQLCPEVNGEVEIVVPTGACGNVTSGFIAAQMGLPVKYVCAVTNNDVVARTINHGDYSISDQVVPSLASAMDIAVPYNMERIFHIFSDGDAELVNKLMQDIETTQKCDIPSKVMEKIKKLVSGYVVDDNGIKAAMTRCWNSNKYLLCPHTATAAKYHYDTIDKKEKVRPRVCVATASPAKFEEAVLSAGLTPQPTESVKKLDDMKTKYVDVEKNENFLQVIRNKIVEIAKTI